MSWEEELTALLGKRVRVRLSPEDAAIPSVITEGKLLGFADSGAIEVLEDDGFVHYCWPALDVERVRE